MKPYFKHLKMFVVNSRSLKHNDDYDKVNHAIVRLKKLDSDEMSINNESGTYIFTNTRRQPDRSWNRKIGKLRMTNEFFHS